MDYGLILTWSVSLRNHEFACDAIIVYKESNMNESLIDSPTVSMILFIKVNLKFSCQVF